LKEGRVQGLWPLSEPWLSGGSGGFGPRRRPPWGGGGTVGRWEGVLLDDGAGFALGCGHAHRTQDLAARCVSMEVGYCDWVRPYRKSTRGAWAPSDYSVMVKLPRDR